MSFELTLRRSRLGGRTGALLEELAIAASNDGDGATPENILTGSLSGRMTN